ncbi:MAG: hypothetical protein A2255_07270 [Candidatus Melainabacteria bacterium RIFOXYA2_FULL_32_9]|nr:MAG: hypothetical protein A2255_07270 [Candidatus Melainabacteria bacterium RIFOXYA2_FULL_32_9]
MGLVASQARILMLTSRKSDLEFAMQQISQRRMMLAQATMSLAQTQMAAGPEAQEDPRSAMLQQVDKMLEMQSLQFQTLHKTVSTELESVQKIIDKNIERSFKYVA